jgi:hypothetical protein
MLRATVVLLGAATLTTLARHLLRDIHKSADARSQPHRRKAVIFGGADMNLGSKHVTHQSLTVIFGGATLDLRNAIIEDAATVDAFVMFGGIQILVPPAWRVRLAGSAIFGGHDNRTTDNDVLPAHAPELNITATTVFGGIEVTNHPTRHAKHSANTTHGSPARNAGFLTSTR